MWLVCCHCLPALLPQVPRLLEPSPLHLPPHHSSNIPSQILINPPCYDSHPLFTSLSRPCTSIPCLPFSWLISLTTMYFYPMLTFLLTHLSHDHVLLSHAYLSSDSSLSQPCTFSHAYSTMTYKSPISETYLKNQLLAVNTQLSLTQIYLSIWSSSSWNLCLDISILLRYIFILQPHCL